MPSKMSFSYNSTQFAAALQGEWIGQTLPQEELHFVITDSRNYVQQPGGAFFAIKGDRFDGHKFCKELAFKGQKVFVVSKVLDLPKGCCQLLVKDTLIALQELAAVHRSAFRGKVIGITGSNGKTIVKEWLYELLSLQFKTYKSPKSFNSQIGVALALLNADIDCEFYLIEAGVSQQREMQKLAKMIQPEIGVFTHLGSAHSEGFSSNKDKFFEKCMLFEHTQKVFLQDEIQFKKEFPYRAEILLVGTDFSSDYLFAFYENSFTVKTLTKSWNFDYHHKDAITKTNMSMALAVALELGVDSKKILGKPDKLQTPAMRLELLEGYHNCTIINDTWTNDTDALNAAIDFLIQQKKQSKTTLVLSDFPDGTGNDAYKKAAEVINNKGLDMFVGVGNVWQEMQNLIHAKTKFVFSDTAELLSNMQHLPFVDMAILIKGSRKYQLELLASRLQLKTHETTLEINLDNLAHNFHFLKNILRPETKIMAMVKAFAYGSGDYEVAKLLEYHRVDYLAVAFVDEGVSLRNSGIKVPILVLNPELGDIDKYVEYALEPAVGSFSQLKAFASAGQQIKVHVELDTGMHRLGFQSFERELLINKLKEIKGLTVQGIFTHLAAADESIEDSKTQKQISDFEEYSRFLIQQLDCHPILHISNSAGTIRFKEAGGDMVRLGIALYGIDPSGVLNKNLKNVFTFKTHITQIKTIKAGEGVGYGFHNQENQARKIAVIAVGYADGFNRKFSQRNHYVLIHGHQAQVIGNVCMDMTMVDVTEISCEEGDSVLVFGEDLSVHSWAEKLDTIPYEILTSISQRVRRIFISEN